MVQQVSRLGQLDYIPRAVFKDWDDSISIHFLVTRGCVLLDGVERFKFFFARQTFRSY